MGTELSNIGLTYFRGGLDVHPKSNRLKTQRNFIFSP